LDVTLGEYVAVVTVEQRQAESGRSELFVTADSPEGVYEIQHEKYFSWSEATDVAASGVCRAKTERQRCQILGDTVADGATRSLGNEVKQLVTNGDRSDAVIVLLSTLIDTPQGRTTGGI
jgi:hypothetical protein